MNRKLLAASITAVAMTVIGIYSINRKINQAKLKPTISYPRYVRNPNTGTWAVQTGFGQADFDCSIPPPVTCAGDVVLYFGKICVHIDNNDIIGMESAKAPTGKEYQYVDSISAVGFYSRYVHEQDSMQRIKDNINRLENELERQADSTWKAQHTYPEK